MTQPATAERLSPAQLAALLTLVKAQAAVRQQLTQTAVAAAMTAFQGVTNWWLADQVADAISGALRIIRPSQRQAAQITASYLAQTSRIISGRSQRTAPLADLSKLRKDMTPGEADEWLDGIRVPAWVVLGDSHEGPADTIDDPAALAAAQAEKWLDAATPYGRVADAYRFNVVMRGDSEETAAAKVIARVAAVAETDVTLAVRAQYQQSMSAHGALGFRRILHPELSETGPCALCVVAADRLYKSEDLLPIHGHCVPTGTRVAADNVLAVTRRSYTGPLVVLLTASGQELTITPNHPVLTDKGWVPAGLIDERHHLVRHSTRHGAVGRSPYEGDGPALVEDVWRAATVDGALHPRTVPLSAEDFHGDGFDGEVEIISTDGLFSRVGDVSLGHPASECLLVSGHGFGVGLAGAGSLLDLAVRPCGSAHRSIGGRGDRGTLHAGGAGVSVLHRLGLTAGLNARFLQSEIDHPAFDAVLLRQREHRDACAVLLDDLGDRQDLPDTPRFDPAGFEFAGEGRHAYAQLGRDLRDRLASDVELDRIVNYRRVEGTCHVYNLHTTGGWYSANNLIVSNCVCEVLPVYEGADPGIHLNGDDLRTLYEAAGGNTRAALRKVTAALTEHAELGPILVDANQDNRGPVDYARQKTSRDPVKYAAQLAAMEKLHDITRYRVSRGDQLEKTLRNQTDRIQELRHLAGVA